MSLTPFRRPIVAAPAAALALVIACALSAAPAFAHHHDEDPGAKAAGDASAPETETATAAPAAAEELSVNGMPVNDPASFTTSISAPEIAPAVSLHTTAKIMNNTAVTNELKAALKANALDGPTPSVAPPPQDHLGTPAPADAAPVAAPASAEPPKDSIRFEVAPQAASDATARTTDGSGAAPASGGRAGLGVALVLLAAAGLGGGYFFSRRMRRGETGA